MRASETVMRLERLGSMHASRLSFMRTLLRRLRDESWRFKRLRFQFNAQGEGVAVYAMKGPQRTYSLVAFGHDLPAEMRSDRVIATAWDATFTLFDGIPNDADIQRLRDHVPKQEAGRVSESELCLSRANRSVRLWDHVIERLSQGLQPDAEKLDETGYLLRTTAVYGSGKFGAADRELIADRPEFRAPFQAEMLSVFLIRQFARDWVEDIARQRGGDQAVAMDEALAQRLGIGNSTGLGMAPFILNHPVLLDRWIRAREQAIAEVMALPEINPNDWARVVNLLQRYQRDIQHWHSDHPVMHVRLPKLREDVESLIHQMRLGPGRWDSLMQWAQDHLGVECQELLASMMLEPYPQVDRFADQMSADEAGLPPLDGQMSCQAAIDQIQTRYDWALQTPWDQAQSTARLWYVSAEKLEPRLAERLDEPLEPYEQPLAPARDMAQAYSDLKNHPQHILAEFLLRYPEHRQALQRLQWLMDAEYGEIQDNTISADLLPIDMLRCKLSFFGAGRFDPRSDRWVRICMFRHAPYGDGIANCPDDWMYLPEPADAGAA